MLNITDRIDEILMDNEGSDFSVKKLRATLILEDYKDKDISAEIKERGLITKKVSFASSYYDWLVAGARTRNEAELYIKGLGEFGETSKNVAETNFKHYLGLFELTDRIRNS
jgi:hypothetical protein